MTTIGIHPQFNRKDCAQQLTTFLMQQHQRGYTVAVGTFAHLIPPGVNGKIKSKISTTRAPFPPFNGGGAAA